MADDVGRVIVIGCSSFVSPEDIIKEMVNTELPEPSLLSGLKTFPWKIENKYYTADIQLCYSSSSTLPPQCEFTSNVEFQAVIIICDSKKASSFEKVATWMPYIKSQEPSVMLLLESGREDAETEKGQDEGMSRKGLFEWCLDNTFELIDLEPEKDDLEEYDDFAEKTGVARVIQALQCGEWPNMELRDSRRLKLPRVEEEEHTSNGEGKSETLNESKAACGSQVNAPTAPKPAASAENGDQAAKLAGLLPDDDLGLLTSLASNEDPSAESFEELFAKMQTMKDRAASMPSDERKAYAEKVAIAFWRAIGGDEDEVAGIDDDSD